MKSRSSERGITSWFPLIEARLELLLLAAAHRLRQRYSDHEGAAVEHLLDERAEAEKDEACDPSHQEIDSDGRAPWQGSSACDRRSRCPFRRHQHRHRRIDAAIPDRHTGKLQSYLHPGDRSQQREIVDVAEMADPKNAVLENPQSVPQAHVEPPQNQRA